MSMLDMNLCTFADALESKAPVPGGGGASALCGALAASLGAMVGNLTVGKAKYAQVEPEIIALTDKAVELKVQLLSLIDADAIGFEPLSRAYSIPKDQPDRDEIMEKCLMDAAKVPMEIMELSCRVIELQEGFARMGSKLAVSDAGTGAAIALAAMEGAALNVAVNTRLMKNTAAAEKLDSKVNSLLAEYKPRGEQVYKDVFDRLRSE